MIFDPATLNFNVPLAEICHIVIQGAAGSTFSVWLDNFQWDTSQQGYLNSWDPAVALPIKPGQYLYFFWSDPDTDGTPPKVTLWLRYDADIAANQANMLNGGVS